MSDASGFQFVADPHGWNPPGAGLVARIPAGIRSKQKLLAIVAERLDFPAWVGRNWDAFEEALRDLSWLAPGTVTIVHSDLPFGAGGENRRIYLSILRDASLYWAADPNRKLAAVFPASAADAVAAAINPSVP